MPKTARLRPARYCFFCSHLVHKVPSTVSLVGWLQHGHDGYKEFNIVSHIHTIYATVGYVNLLLGFVQDPQLDVGVHAVQVLQKGNS